MQVAEDKIAARLVEKTGQSPDEIRAQLDEFKNRLRLVVKSGKSFAIDGFGTFHKMEGTLQFEPDRQLQNEINQQHAGMQPIELVAASREAGAGIPVEEERPKETAEATPAPVEELKPDVPAGEERAAGQAASNRPEETSPEKQEQPTDRPAPNVEEEAAIPAAKRSKEAKQKPAFGRNRSKNGAIGRAVLASVVVIIILGIGWFLYDHGALRNLTTGQQSVATDSSEQTATGEPSITEGGDSARQATPAPGSTEQKSGATVSTKQNGAASPATTKYGLKGSFNDQLKGAYTIVVHSFHLKSTVQQIANRLQKAGYRTVLFQNGKGAGSWWRLGLGQFKTAESAQDSAQTLRAPFKKNHLIRQIPDNH